MYGGFGFAPYRISDPVASATANAASASARDAKTEVGILKAEVDRLLMITEALWTILQEEHGYNDDKLVNRINEIDLRDGHLDGRVAKQGGPAKCPNCQKSLSKRHHRCLYCGTVVTPGTFDR